MGIKAFENTLIGLELYFIVAQLGLQDLALIL